MDGNVKIEMISLKTGVLTGLALILFFIAVRIIGLVHILELRALNFAILLPGILVVIQKVKAFSNSPMSYLEGLAAGIFTSITAVTTLAAFMLIYLTTLEPSFMETIKEKAMFGQHLNPYIASFTIIIEGVGSGLITTFIVMQYKKNPYKV